MPNAHDSIERCPHGWPIMEHGGCLQCQPKTCEHGVDARADCWQCLSGVEQEQLAPIVEKLADEARTWATIAEDDSRQARASAELACALTSWVNQTRALLTMLNLRQSSGESRP